MLAAALDGAQVRLGVPVLGARTSQSGATLQLADGSVAGADVVVGADGIHSAVRTNRCGPSRRASAGGSPTGRWCPEVR